MTDYRSGKITIRDFRINRPVPVVRREIARYFDALVKMSGKDLRVTDDLKAAADKVAEWLVNGNTYGLKIMGGCGTGKSTLLEAVRCYIIDYMETQPFGKRVHMGTYQAVEITDIFRHDDDESELFFRYKFIGIDDLGTEPTTVKHYGSALMPLTDILHRRANDLKMTIVVTNLDPEQLREKYGPRVYDRLRDMTTIILNGESNRGQHG